MKTVKDVKTKLVATLAAASVLCAGTLMFACDNNEPPKSETPQTPDLPVTPPTATEKLDAGLTKLLEANGLSGLVTLALDADGQKTDYEYSYVKSGYRVEATDGDDKYIIDLDSGYFYSVDKDGTTAEQIFDSGRYGYIASAAKTELAGKFEEYGIDDYVTVGDDGSVRFFVDYKTEVNSLLKTVGNYYEDGTLYQLIDAFLAENGNTLGGVLSNIEAFVILFQNQSAALAENTIDVFLADYNTSLKQIFTSYGVTEEQYAAVSRRKIGEMAEGVIALYNEAESLIPELINGGTLDKTTEQIVQEVFDVLFVNEVDTSNLATDVKEFKDTITDWLNITKVKTAVELIAEQTGRGEIATALENNVTFSALQFETVVKFDENGNISEIAYDAQVKCGYTVDGEPFDYAYTASGKATIGYAETPTITLPSGAAVEELSLKVFAAADGDTVAFIETGSIGGALDITAYTVDGEPVLTEVDYAPVTFDAGKSILTFDKRIASELRNVEHNVQVEITGTLGGAPIIIIYTVPVDYTLDSLL